MLRRFTRRRRRYKVRLARQEVDDLAQRSQLSELIRGYDGGAREGFLKGGQDLDPLDGIDAEVGVEVHRDIEHINRVTRFFGDDTKNNLRDVRRTTGSIRRTHDDTIRGRVGGCRRLSHGTVHRRCVRLDQD